MKFHRIAEGVEAAAVTESTEVAPSQCPGCKRTLYVASSFQANAIPKPGDPTVCLYCGEILEFRADMQLKPISRELRRKLARRQPEIYDQMMEMQRRFSAPGEKLFINRKKPERPQ